VAESAEITALRAKIAEAKEALHKLMCGDKEVQVGFGTNRMTQWNVARVPDLRAYIDELEGELSRALGSTAGRRGPIYPVGFSR
jgi:hypothetical protein